MNSTLNFESSIHQPQTLPMYMTYGLECPFAWEKDPYNLLRIRNIHIFPSGMNPTLSFTVTRNSKVLGYIPLVGTAIGVYRIYMGIREYLFFKNGPLDSLSNRSLIWITRGAIELIPVLGVLVCIIIDLIATSRYDSTQNSLIIEDNNSHSDLPTSHDSMNIDENTDNALPSVQTSMARITANERDPTIFIKGAQGKFYPSVLNKIDPTDLSTALKIFSLSAENAKNLEVIEKRYVFLIDSLKKTQFRLSAYMKQELQVQIDYVHSVYRTLIAYASSFPQDNPNEPAYELEEIDD
jgi:hypothetical protein